MLLLLLLWRLMVGMWLVSSQEQLCWAHSTKPWCTVLLLLLMRLLQGSQDYFCI
jgi:hypothetical protein